MRQKIPNNHASRPYLFGQSKIPVTRNFYGRKSELTKLTLLYNENHVFSVLGVAGVGKTTLVGQFAGGLAKRGKKVIWITLRKGFNPIITFLLSFYNYLDNNDLLFIQTFTNTIGSTNRKISFERMTSTINNIIAKEKLVVCVDNVQFIDHTIFRHFFRNIAISIQGKKGINAKLILIGHNSNIPEVAQSMVLEGVNFRDFRNLISKNLKVKNSIDFLCKLHHQIDGNPRILKLLCNTGLINREDFLEAKEFPGNIANYPEVFNYIYNDVAMLSKGELGLAKLISTKQFPMNMDSLYKLSNGITPQRLKHDIVGLKNKGLLSTLPNSFFKLSACYHNYFMNYG